MAIRKKVNPVSKPVPARRRPEYEQTKSRSPKIKRTPLVRHTARRIVLFVMLFVVLSMGMLVGLTVGWVDYKLEQLETIEFLENYRPWMPTRMFAGDQPEFMIADFFNEKQNRQQVPLSAMPQDLINAVVALEDSRFFSHFGISLPDFCRAAYVNLKASYESKRLRIIEGASTLTIQLAEDLIKNGHLPYDLEEMELRSVKQKIWEWFLALKIEKRYSKSEILEIYLNQVFLGGNIYGVARAAKVYFGKDVQDLSLKECALFAGMLRGPNNYTPIKNPQNAEKRTRIVLNAMLRHGFITQPQFDQALDQPFDLQTESIRSTQVAHYPYFSETVRREFELGEIRNFDGTPIQIFGQGVDIESTIDTRLQEIAEKALQKGIIAQEQIHRSSGGRDWGRTNYIMANRERGKKTKTLVPGEEYDAKITSEFMEDRQHVTVTLPNVIGGDKDFPVTIDPEKTWLREFDLLHPGNFIRVKSIEKDNQIELALAKNTHVQGALIAIQPSTGKILATVGGYRYNTNDQLLRTVQTTQAQPGSAFKPLLYTAALAEPDGLWTPASLLRDEETEFWTDWTPGNFSKEFYGQASMRFSLAKSLNSASVWLLDNYKGSRTKGIESFRQFCRFVYGLDVKDRNLSIALGTPGMSPQQLAQAYAVIANRGDFVKLHTVEYVKQRDYRSDAIQVSDSSNILYQFQQPYNERRRISPQVAFLGNYLMSQVVADETYGTARKAAQLPFYSAGKTGTTDDCTYAWYAGYTRDLLCIVYMAYDDPSKSLGVRQTGSSVALPVWMDFMEQAFGILPELFGDITAPEGIVYRDICEDSSFLATAECEKTQRMPFIEGTEPRIPCTLHGSDTLQPYKNETIRLLLDRNLISQSQEFMY